MIVGTNGKLIEPGRTPCPGCQSTKHRQLVTGFGGYWSVACLACGETVDKGRGDPPADGEY